MASVAPVNAAIGDAATLEAVRPEVRRMLLQAPAFAKLKPAEQLEIANRTVKVSAYLANPDGVLTDVAGEPGVALARAQADASEATRERLAKAPGQVGKDFQAGAVKQGVEQFGALVKKVDFPKFVGGLIQNVFQAIVDASIQQMRAYGELIANVAKTVDEFAQDNISQNNARDWLGGKYPNAIRGENGSTSAAPAGGGGA